MSKLFSFVLFVLALIITAHHAINYWNYFSDISIVATMDGYKCVTTFTPQPVMSCFEFGVKK